MTSGASLIVIFSDGGSRGNPGNAASAFAIFLDGKLIHANAKYLGITTNNVAEYNGVIIALEGFLEEKNKGSFANAADDMVTFKMDSELVVKQLKGEYKIKDKNLMELSLKVKKLISDNKLNINFVHVMREQNKLADKMVNEKLDAISHHSTN